MNKATVLAVDDTPANLIALEAVLQRDFKLLTATSGHEALELLGKHEDVDVILMDLQMPGMDGFETASLVKRMPGCEDIPIVFITAYYADDAIVKRAYHVGGIDYFAKPYDPDLLRLKLSIYASFRQRAAVLQERERQIRETEELSAAGKKLSAMLESLPVGVLISDTEGRICQVNDEASRIFNATSVLESDAYGDILHWWDSSGQLLKDEQGPLSLSLIHI